MSQIGVQFSVLLLVVLLCPV